MLQADMCQKQKNCSPPFLSLFFVEIFHELNQSMHISFHFGLSYSSFLNIWSMALNAQRTRNGVASHSPTISNRLTTASERLIDGIRQYDSRIESVIRRNGGRGRRIFHSSSTLYPDRRHVSHRKTMVDETSIVGALISGPKDISRVICIRTRKEYTMSVHPKTRRIERSRNEGEK